MIEDRMPTIEEKFAKLGTDHAPGQEVRQAVNAAEMPLRGDPIPGKPVDFSHGDVDETAFGPTPRRRWLRTLGTHAGPGMARLKQTGRP